MTCPLVQFDLLLVLFLKEIIGFLSENLCFRMEPLTDTVVVNVGAVPVDVVVRIVPSAAGHSNRSTLNFMINTVDWVAMINYVFANLNIRPNYEWFLYNCSYTVNSVAIPINYALVYPLPMSRELHRFISSLFLRAVALDLTFDADPFHCDCVLTLVVHN